MMKNERMMKLNSKIKAIIKNIALTFMVAILVFTTACSKGPEGVVAKVNDTDITEDEFNRDYAAQANNAILMSNNPDILDEATADDPKTTMGQELRRQVLENLIQMELVRQDAEKKDVKVDESKVTEQIENVKNQFGGEETFNEQLKAVGMTPEFYENYVRNSLLMNKYYEELVKEFEPTDEDLQKYFKDHKDEYFNATASHILVSDVNEANKIKKELDKGADFAEMAKEKSTDQSTAPKGGDLGSFNNGSMVQPFNDAIKSMDKGDISDPVKTDFGYHIIKLTDKKAREFDDVKDELKQTYTQEKVKEYVDKLQKDAKIKRYLDPKDDYTLPEKYAVSLPKEDKNAAETNKKNEAKNAETKNNNKNVKANDNKQNAEANKKDNNKQN
jgi:foldase protein PrsA